MAWADDRFEGLPVRIQLPAGYGPHRRWPLIVFLHGSGERGSDNQGQLKHGAAHFAGLDAIVVAPQCPKDDSWGGTWFGGPTRSQGAVVAIAALMRKRVTVDPRRVFLVGCSMGAIGGWEILANAPDTFDAAVLLCGEPDVAWAPRLVGRRIWSFHGDADPVVPIGPARAVHAQLPPPARFTALPGLGHDIWDAALTHPGLFDWLLV